jgi:hypothetical protein
MQVVPLVWQLFVEDIAPDFSNFIHKRVEVVVDYFSIVPYQSDELVQGVKASK